MHAEQNQNRKIKTKQKPVEWENFWISEIRRASESKHGSSN